MSAESLLRRDGERVDSLGNTFLECDVCQAHLPWLVFLWGRLVCRTCYQNAIRHGGFPR